jgi:nucleoside-diphosphate-sugar epimerase
MIAVCGAGGFIGGWLVKRLLADGNEVRAVDIKPFIDWYQKHPEAENRVLDLKRISDCHTAVAGCSKVYNLAADMGGIGFIESHKVACMLNVLINTHLLMAASEAKVERFFFSSSACVYAADKQTNPSIRGLVEADAYPASPEDGYGWEKLFSERMCRHFAEDVGLQIRVARYHNIYGSHGAFRGGREKAPAAICRKVAEAVINRAGGIEIWGDGSKTRSFTWIDDCIEGTLRLMESNCSEPVNIGSSEKVTVDELVGVVESCANVKLERHYLLNSPTGVAGRNSDNSMIRSVLGWEPNTPLVDGISKTYAWIFDQLLAEHHRRANAPWHLR